MSRSVWKFPLRETETRLIAPTPVGSIPRSFGFQRQTPTFWVEVEQDETAFEAWTFIVAGTGTGHPLPPGNWTYVGSAIVAGGDFVFHGYARREQG